ncbi:MAG TPA: [FeFe] hydrogenase H-cluster radical SAM maturase HydE [Thermogutta sp.]|nr:[FeFe] hydrogenase H-cluster radical SAM maturase HydE [Thermogutta sp.]HOP77000.1 [FeFe] hydrogenase H-cluster radical SAM maturase HydE [Thermogutta sp.]HPU07104.1 [FeFe] hydrogenase H-cluster radical SAM maturase HydE [Thermogutta sp.]HQF13499.1 [FeFe] hydrogenase H-cluster radical SAM maturase HydE [Thermogutta sp.]
MFGTTVKEPALTREELLTWLREEDPARLSQLWQWADRVRQEFVGGEVHLRGLIEISNHCVRLCAYCGLRAPNTELVRYRMSGDEILACARQAAALGYGTVVLQAGEDPGLTRDFVREIVRRIKETTGLAITLSLGERDEEELWAWRQAGADRYLLRFETSQAELYQRYHPPKPGSTVDRLYLLKRLREMGYEVGSGVMIGLPGQTYAGLANDLWLFRELDLDMIGVGPFIVHPRTPLADPAFARILPDGEQVPASELMTYKVIALSRILCPRANIPSTTALATLNRKNGRELGLVRGANVVMPNLTPPQYRIRYEIYPNKACLRETPDECHACLQMRVESLGRVVGRGPGTSPNYRYRMAKD